ncbi:MAG: aquaporin [Gracilimonas sp.]|uniref:MIP/aquaporin family protein n=1 Tax=Gracilimonas TaxID=649462 RepID=UPI001B25E386|nr:aquaporin [Gracilimonas sp.]MBO6584962.1 aquaporin [Gracilimonas sp.]MBO6615767.1 aquaporin [Gracilimonas sp.]
MHSYVMEAIGAFFLVLVFGFTGDPLAIGLTLMALVYIGSRVSGAHYNPAVSLAFFLKRRLSGAELAGYLIAQLFGAFLAAAAIFFLSTSVFYIEPPSTTNLYQQVFAEVVFTFIFVLVMLTLTFTKSFRKNSLSGLAVGLTFGGMLMVATPVSGGILNPATSIGTASFDLINGGNSIIHSLLYTLAPLTGGALAAFAFSYFHRSEF